MNRRAISMLEIIIAVAILVVAVVPLFTLMSKQTTDTGLVASQAYAINKASETLNAILDNVPFAAIRQGNPGYLAVDDISKMAKFTRYDDNWAKKMSTMLFNNSPFPQPNSSTMGLLFSKKSAHRPLNSCGVSSRSVATGSNR